MFELDTVNDPDNIIIVKASGKWSVIDVERLYIPLNRELAKRRAAGICIRVLYDICQLTSIGFAVSTSTVRHLRRSFGPSDRVAILTADAGQKANLRIDMGSTGVAVFSSRLPAEMWLVSDLERPH